MLRAILPEFHQIPRLMPLCLVVTVQDASPLATIHTRRTPRLPATTHLVVVLIGRGSSLLLNLVVVLAGPLGLDKHILGSFLTWLWGFLLHGQRLRMQRLPLFLLLLLLLMTARIFLVHPIILLIHGDTLIKMILLAQLELPCQLEVSYFFF
jgi:hypothetical protein